MGTRDGRARKSAYTRTAAAAGGQSRCDRARLHRGSPPSRRARARALGVGRLSRLPASRASAADGAHASAPLLLLRAASQPEPAQLRHRVLQHEPQARPVRAHDGVAA